MKQLISLVALFTITSCTTPTKVEVTTERTSLFSSSDVDLVKSYDWAKNMALSYSHEGLDPVGLWYEAALPSREAFCMRDVSHQVVGAQILGLGQHNLNMMTKFAENISESKDWCTYWEIDRNDKPAKADYLNDDEFWYNLNANFDVIDACLKLYQWTGDVTYLRDAKFVNFYQKSLNEYVERWDLQVEKIMNRPRFMNSPENFDKNNMFHACRGLPSYVESMPGITVSADLLSTIYAGIKAYSQMALIEGDGVESGKYEALANQYKALLKDLWWDETNKCFYSLKTEDNKFHSGEGQTYVVWFNATDDVDRIKATVDNLLNSNLNVENLSHFPALFYRLDYWQQAYDLLLKLPTVNRCEYPEVSYGVVDGIVGGLMGINPEASLGRITTMPRLTDKTQWAKIENVPVFDGFITVRHDAKVSSEFTNNTSKTLIWRASFLGQYPNVKVKGNVFETILSVDKMGNNYSYLDMRVEPSETIRIDL